MTNPNASLFYKKVSEDHRTYYLPHNLFLSQNLYINSDDRGPSQISYKPFPFRSSLPIPITSPDAIEVNDPCCQYTSSKEAWKYKIRIMKTAHRKLMKHRMTEIKLNSNGAYEIPVYLLKFTRLLHEDPDPYFDSYYNWYLSGNGNLCLIDIAGNTYLLKSFSNELGIQNLNSIQGQKNISEKYVCENHGLIHETIIQGMPQGNVIGLRQKHHINLVSLNSNEDSTKPKLLKTLKAEIPFTSFVFDDAYNGVITANTKGTVQMYDIDADKIIDIVNNDADIKTVDNWSSIQIFDTNSILQTSKNHLTILDSRDQQNSHVISPVFQMECDNMTSSKICSSKPHALFIGTIHNLFFCDLRYLKTNTFVAKWSHGLKYPPLFISTKALEDREMISVSSQLSEDLSIIMHPFNEEIKTGDLNVSDSEIYFPWRPPCIKKTLDNAQKFGLCLDPTVNLKKRLQMSTTGMKFWSNQDDFNLLILNSVGDVFSQTFDREQTKYSDEGEKYTHLDSWAEQLLQKDRLLFTVSSQVNMSNVQGVLKKLNPPRVRQRRSQKLLASKRRWKRSLKGLNDYTDMWANELLSVWESEETDRKIDELIPPPADTKFKVDTWMNQFSAEDDF